MKMRSIINSIIKRIIMTGTVIALMSISAGPVMANTAQDGKSAETAFEIGGSSEEIAWTNLKNALGSGAGVKREDESADAPTYFKLIKDCTSASGDSEYDINIDASRSVVLDLNGHKIDRKRQEYGAPGGNYGYVIRLNSGAKLTVTDSTADDENPAGYGLITGGYGNVGGGISLASGQTVLILRGGTISGNRAIAGAGVGFSKEGRVEVDGGIICDNHARFTGGGIGGTDLESYHIEIKGGKIDGNTAGDGSSTAYGGGIGISRKDGSSGSFIMTGGEITNNSAVSGDGGGVYTTVSFNLAGGIISGNRAEKTGGGICQTTKKFIMEGGIIMDNTAALYGGGLCLSSASSATLRGGSISGNEAGDGGGVFVGNESSLTMEDGFAITGNTANNGGGVYHYGSLDGTDKFDMKGGEISGNTADRGGGIYSFSTLNLTGGRITGNNAGKGDSPWGGGVFYHCALYSDHSLNVSGSPIVIGNVRRGNFINGVLTGGEDDNIYLYSAGDNKNVNITVSGILSKDAILGVSVSPSNNEDYPGIAAASPGYQSGNLTAEDISHFTSDYRNRAVILKEDEGVKVAGFTPSYFGTDHVTVRRGAEGSELTLAQYDTSGKMTSVQRKIILKDVLDEPLSDMGISIPSKGAYKLLLSDRRTGIPLYDAISSGLSEESGGSGYKWISDDTHLKTYSDNVTLECRSDGMPYYRLTCKIDDRDYRLAGIGYILTAVLKGRTGETGDDIVYADQLNYNRFGTKGILKFDGTGSGFALRKNWSSEIYLNGEKVALIIPENEEPSPSLITKDPVGKTGLKYDGSGQELIIPGKAENGTMYYAVTMKGESRPNKASFSAELPKKTNPGTYTVWYMSKGNGNYMDTEIFSLDVSIADEKGHIHKLIHHSFKDSTYTEEGNIEYWECDECHLFFDRNGNVITDVVIKKKDASKEEKEEEGGNDDEKEHKKTASELAEEKIKDAKKAAEEGKGAVTDTVVIKKTGKTLTLDFNGSASGNSVITVAKGNKFKISGGFKGFKSDSKAVKVTKKGKVTAKKATLDTPANISFTGNNDGITYTITVHVLDPADKSASEVISGNSVKIRKMTISAKASDLIDISLKGVPLNAEIGKISDKKKVTEALPGNESIIAIGDDGFYHLKAQLVKKGKVKIPFKVNGKKFGYTLKIKK